MLPCTVPTISMLSSPGVHIAVTSDEDLSILIGEFVITENTIIMVTYSPSSLLSR